MTTELKQILPGRYHPTDVLKEGQERCVLMAHDKLENTRVVIKGATDPLVKEFEREYEFLLATSSSFIVKPYGSFYCNGWFFFVEELYELRTLATQVLEGETLTVKDAVQIIRNISFAFEELNLHGILHRDLQLDHISYKTPNDLKLFDLNLCVRGTISQGESTLSIENPHDYGTWETMAPEEFQIGRLLTPSSNVYSLAALLYRLLEGKYWIDYKTVHSEWASWSIDRQKQAQEMLVNSEQNASFLKTPVNIRPTIQKALSLKPEDRFETLVRFREALFEADS